MAMIIEFRPPVVCERISFHQLCQILTEKPLIKDGIDRLEINNIQVIDALKCAGADEETIDYFSECASQGSNVMLDVLRTLFCPDDKQIWITSYAMQALGVALGIPALDNALQLLKEDYGITISCVDD